MFRSIRLFSRPTFSISAFLLYVGLFSCLQMAVAQDHQEPSKTNVFLELAGSGGLASLNVERSIVTKPVLSLGWRAGISFAPIDRNNGTAIVVPLMIQANLGQNSHRLILGAGQTLSVTTRGSIFFRMPVSLGYQYSFSDSPWFIRISYTPIISYLIDAQWEHWGGIGIGYQIPSR